MEHEKIIDKIKKCLALSNSDNPHEAAAGLRQAQKLMQMHGLNELDIELSDVQEMRAKASNAGVVAWESLLANLISSAFGCQHYTTYERRWLSGSRMRAHRFYVFVGVSPAAEIAQYSFEVLSEQCSKARRRYMNAQRKNCKTETKTARGDVFARGYINGVANLVQGFANSDKTKQLIEHYMDSKYPNMETAKMRDRVKGRNITNNDYFNGNMEARNAQLHHGVGGKKSQGLLS